MSGMDVVIMAAGKGTRMKSRTPKVLHTLGGVPLIEHVIKVSKSLGARRQVVVVGHEASKVQAALAHHEDLMFALQEPQLGTGHALQSAAAHLPVLPNAGCTLVLSGDVPLIGLNTLQALVAASKEQHLTLLTLKTSSPQGYGRIVRTPNANRQVLGIVEEKDASPQERLIEEIYVGVMVIPNAHLHAWLAALNNNNAQQEYYLTDLVAMAVAAKLEVHTHACLDPNEVAGVNDPAQLAHLERAYQRNVAGQLMHAGARLADPARIDVRGEVVVGQDVEIDVGCVFEGRVVLGDGVKIGAHCVVSNAHLSADVVVKPFTHIQGESSAHLITVGEAAQLGPYARLRAGTVLGAEVHIGNFVEIKNSTLGVGSKANHLAYLGDSAVGDRVNVGAGSITANYDGANKHKTVIEDDVHVGSNSVLVAPVTIARGGTVGAGSVISKDTQAGALTLTRAKTVSLAHWSRPQKKPTIPSSG